MTENGLRIGVDVGGTFTDLVAWDGVSLRVVKIPSTPPAFHEAVVDAVARVTRNLDAGRIDVVHGSTVATNALLQRAGEPVAFITTAGFRDMLLIGRQNRPKLYALRVERPAPVTPEENWFTVDERIAADGAVVTGLRDDDVDRVLGEIRDRGIRHVAVCLLFSFVNPSHERRIADRAAAYGLAVSLSSEILPEFREYERASTTAINAALRPTVERYLVELDRGLGESTNGAVADADAGADVRDSDFPTATAATPSLASSRQVTTPPRSSQPPPPRRPTLRIMQSAGGTLSPAQASAHAAKLVLSGPAGGVMGAAFIARQLNIPDAITYDMGGTSTDVATILSGSPQWTTGTTIDGLPIGLPMLDIQTVGAGGGSIARLDPGGALRVGPTSAGAQPGPACYARGGTEPTVTDANLILGRILPEHFLGGAIRLDADLARGALQPLAAATGKSLHEMALGIVRVAEANMARAVRAVTSRRGNDPRNFALISFGGAGGLHACAIAEQLEIARVILPPHCGVLSALGMVVAPPITDVSKTVVHLGEQLDDARLAAEFGYLSAQSSEQIALTDTQSIEAFADVRFKGQSHELKIRVDRPAHESIRAAFVTEYERAYGRAPENRPVEIVTLRLRRIGRATELVLPPIADEELLFGHLRETEIIGPSGTPTRAAVVTRGQLARVGRLVGPALVVDPDATSFVPEVWSATMTQNGTVDLVWHGRL